MLRCGSNEARGQIGGAGPAAWRGRRFLLLPNGWQASHGRRARAPRGFRRQPRSLRLACSEPTAGLPFGARRGSAANFAREVALFGGLVESSSPLVPVMGSKWGGGAAVGGERRGGLGGKGVPRFPVPILTAEGSLGRGLAHVKGA